MGIFAKRRIAKGELIIRTSAEKHFTVKDAFRSIRREIDRSMRQTGNCTMNPAAIMTAGIANEMRKGRDSKLGKIFSIKVFGPPSDPAERLRETERSKNVVESV